MTQPNPKSTRYILVPHPSMAAELPSLLIRGADISSLKKSEDCGGIYRDREGVPGDALQILKEHGLNYARLRVWLNSPDGYHGKAQLLEMARRLRDMGIPLLVDFHYTDTWADPGKQPKPAAWQGLTFDELKNALYEYTCDILGALAAQGTPPGMVQVGNEINNGMVWPDGSNEKKFDALYELVSAGVRAVRETVPAARVMLHVAEGGRNHIYRWWFDEMTSRGADFDVLGVSYYPYWHGTLAEFKANLDDLAERYHKDLIVVETAYPFTLESKDDTENITFDLVEGYPATPEGQARMLAEIIEIIRAVPGGRGLGFFWWDATWTAVEGNGWDAEHPELGNNWENQALFDFDDRPLPALKLFNRKN